MRLAVFADTIAEGLDPPVFGLGDLAATRSQDFGELIGQLFDLLRGNVLPREENMLIEGHEMPFSCFGFVGAEPP